MDIFWSCTAGFLILVGIFGSFLPVLPGPPVSYIGLLVMQLRTEPPFTTRFLAIWAAIVIVVSVLDYVIPVYVTKRFGGTRYGIVGCTVGLLVGFWFGPIGIIAGPFVGALIGELMGHSDSSKALTAALGSFVGFLLGTLLKLIVCFMILYYFVDVFI
jgi:uncharacterized protein YqgC (DUF456 family)